MKRVLLMFLLLAGALFLAACAAPGEAGGAYSGTLVLEGRHAYGPQAVLPGALVVVDGDVALEPGSRVAGPVFLLGGALSLAGQVDGDVSAIGGRLAVLPEARIAGDLRAGSGRLELSPQAAIGGQVLTGAASGIEPEDLFPERSRAQALAWALPEALLLAGLAYLAGRFLPGPAQRVSRAAVRHPLVSAAMGLLAGVVGLVFLVVIAFTLILIPVTMLGLALGFLSIGYGLIGIGLALGRRLGRRWQPARSPGGAAFWGTLLLMLLLNLAALLPLAGDWLNILAAIIALGAVLLTRFGLREFVPEDEIIS